MHIRCGLVIIHRTLIRFLTVFFVQFSINNGDSNNYSFYSMFGQKSVQGMTEFTRKAVDDRVSKIAKLF
uniref:Secreted protein n=1 Tax=Romanomermis culicivorax TaxID=13658 RepID=A0A915HWA9_ROMCU